MKRPCVFVAFSYADSCHAEGDRSPKQYGEDLCHILRTMDFEVLTGGSRERHGRLEETVLEEIARSDWVVVLFCPRAKLATGKYSTSPWVLEEKGAAIALGKNFQILTHEDVDDDEIGGLHGSAYRIVFTQGDQVERFCEAANIISEYARESLGGARPSARNKKTRTPSNKPLRQAAAGRR
jgi:hypothetical protein